MMVSMKTPRMSKKSSLTEAIFLAERAAVARLLPTAKSTKAAAVQLATLSRMLEDGENDTSVAALTRRYICIIYALILQEKWLLLGRAEVKRLVTQGQALLMALGVDSQSSVLAWLHGDLHIIYSQILRNDGLQWEAAWEQQHAVAANQRRGGQAADLQRLIMANRTMRLGHGPQAIEIARSIEASESKDAPLGGKARLLIGQGLLLGASWNEFEARSAARDLNSDSPNAAEGAESTLQKEFDWQLLMLKAWRDHDLDPMITAIKAGGRFYQASYIIEVAMIGYCNPSVRVQKSLPRMSYLIRNRKISLLNQDSWFDCARTMEDAYDDGIPLATRFAHVGEMLEKRNTLSTVDKELLLWAATYRWLRRKRIHEMSELVSLEYQSLCHRLSGGKTNDVLGIIEGTKTRQ